MLRSFHLHGIGGAHGPEQKSETAEDAGEFASPASHEEADESEGCQDDDEVLDMD